MHIISKYVCAKLSVSRLLRKNQIFGLAPRGDFWRNKMANIKSAKKRVLVTQIKTERNKSIRSKVKTCIKNVESAVAAGDKEAAQAALTVAISEIEKASKKNIYHKNNAARKVSRLTKLVNTLA